MTASQLAGFHTATLVQEPVAAGLAYGWNENSDTRPFLVYDLGGGTFDAAVLQSVAGQLVVLGHHGRAVEGGRDMDAAILEQLVLPSISTEIARDELNWIRALECCEQAKIRLSTPGLEQAPVTLTEVLSPSGEPIGESVRLERVALERLVTPQIERTIEVIRELFTEQGLKGTDLRAVVLVGGPTMMPIVRQILREAFGAQIFTRIDPMTVVAQGAALFAASIQKTSRSSGSPRADATQIRLEYDPVANQARVPVGVTGVGAKLPDNSLCRIRRQDGLWDSGLVKIAGGQGVITVALADAPLSVFWLEVFNPDGSPVRIEPDEFQITRGIAAASPPLSRAIGVLIDDPFGGDQRVAIQKDAERGHPTPLISRGRYVTTIPLIPGSPKEILRVGVFEGPQTVSTTFLPERGHLIGDVVLRGTHIDRPLPVGTELEVTIRIDPSREASASIYIPDLEITIPPEKLVEFARTPVPTLADLQIRLDSTKARLQDLEAAGLSLQDVKPKEAAATQAVESAVISGSDGIARAEARVGELELAVDEIEERHAPRLALEELTQFMDFSRDLVEEYGDPQHKELFAQLERDAIRARDRNNATEARSIRERALNLAGVVYWSQTAAWVSRFQELASFEGFTDKERAQMLLLQGRQALKQGDQELLRRTVLDLLSITPREDQQARWSMYSGITRRTL
jgi:molecular chaperone DnaK